VEIVRGEDRTILVKIKSSDGEPHDLTAATEISAVFKNSDASTTTKLLSTAGIAIVGSPLLGHIDITLTDAETLLLGAGTLGFEVEIDEGADKRIVQLLKSLTVVDRL